MSSVSLARMGNLDTWPLSGQARHVATISRTGWPVWFFSGWFYDRVCRLLKVVLSHLEDWPPDVDLSLTQFYMMTVFASGLNFWSSGGRTDRVRT